MTNRVFRSVAPAIAPSYSRAGVVVNFVTATGGDVEMLRSIECFYKCVFHLHSYGCCADTLRRNRIKCVSIGITSVLPS